MVKMKRVLVAVLTIALAFGCSLPAAPKAEAAARPKKLKVKVGKKVLYVGGTAAQRTTKIKVKVSPKKASKKVTYKSSNKKVATVSKKGKVTAKKKGTVKITVTSKSNKKLKKKIKIKVKNYKPGTGTPQTTPTPAPADTSNPDPTQKPADTSNPDLTPTPADTTKPDPTPTQTPAPTPEPAQNPDSVSMAESANLYLKGDLAASTTKLTAALSPKNVVNKSLTWTSSDESIATVDTTGKVTGHKLGKAVITVTTVNDKSASCEVTVSPGTVSVHDPSVVKGNDGFYYIYGSHTAFAKTNNFMGWTIVTNNISKKKTDTTSIFKDYWENWARYNNKGNPNMTNNDKEATNLAGNQWAPDVIWNEQMGKWCMYMSVNGPDYNSVIVLCTADKLDGDWTVVGPVVYSGFTKNSGAAKHDYTLTDYTRATGDETLNTRYGNGSWNMNYGTNAIDPCVKYDDKGDLWMSYGSWYGGIYFLKLDKTTGLRDYTYTYEYDTDDRDGTTSDPYMGIRVAGGSRASGEASYIIEKDGYYYMFLSYGALESAGGYNMRVFRSRNITGPYVDKMGKNALRTSTNDGGNTLGNTGIRLMAGYQWSCNSTGYLAQGHNSALVDDDGKMYLVYHSRFDDNGEYHRVETHQMFMSEDGWLCVAPYEYNGEEISETGYNESELTGTYEYLVQNPAQKNGTCATTSYITLGSGGAVGGLDNAASWEIKDGKPYVTFTFNGVKYQGVFSYGYEESAERNKVMTFTAVGENNVCIWGSKTLKDVKSDADSVAADKEKLSLAAEVTGDFALPACGAYGSAITWTVEDENVISIQGRKAEINRRLTDTHTKLTAVITKGSSTDTKEFDIKLKKYDVALGNAIDPNEDDKIELVSSEGDMTVTWTSDKEDVINPVTGAVKTVINDTVVTLTATLKLEGDDDVQKTFPVTVKGIPINVSTIVKLRSIPLPSESRGYSITWSSDDSSIIAVNGNTGTVHAHETEVKTVRLTATITKGEETDTRDFDMRVLPNEITDFLYRQDYQNVTDVKAVFSSGSLAGGMSIQSEGTNKFFQFQQDAGHSGNRGALSADFTGVSEEKEYIVELDLMIRSGNVADRSQSQFVLTGIDSDVAYDNNGGLGADANYILKLSTGQSSKVWTINDTDKTVTLPDDQWVHVTAGVNAVTGKVAVEITQTTDGETVSLCNYEVPIKGAGILKGIYILSGRGNGLTKLDDIKVYK